MTAAAWWARPREISLFGGAKDATPKGAICSWASLADTLTRHPVREGARKDDLPAWSPARYPAGARRGEASVLDVGYLVLDFDAAPDLEAIHDRWREWEYVLHSSWSHSPEAPRYRLVVPLAEPVTTAHWGRVWAWAAERDPTIDVACKDASRLYYLPARPTESAPCVARLHRGPPLALDVAALPETTTERLTREARERRARGEVQPLPGTTTEIERARYRSDPGVREDVAMQLGATVGGDGPKRRARDAECPWCGRRSVWWLIEPLGRGGEMVQCKHEQSCGFYGFLDQLLINATGGYAQGRG